MNHRVFIAINPPENIKKKLLFFQRELKKIPARWAKEDNLHITLIFLGNLKDEELFEVSQVIQDVSRSVSPFTIRLNKICYGPPGKIPPRMIWILGEKSQPLANLRESSEKELLAADKLGGIKIERREFAPHITLGRIRQWEWQRLDPEEIQETEKDISLSFEVQSIELMESRLKRGGTEYAILQTCNLEHEE